MHLRLRRFVGRSGRTRINPLFDQRDSCSIERRLLVRHWGQLSVRATKHLYDQALLPITDKNCRPMLPALPCECGRIEPQTGFLLRRTVTPITILGQNRFDLLFVVQSLASRREENQHRHQRRRDWLHQSKYRNCPPPGKAKDLFTAFPLPIRLAVNQLSGAMKIEGIKGCYEKTRGLFYFA